MSNARFTFVSFVVSQCTLEVLQRAEHLDYRLPRDRLHPGQLGLSMSIFVTGQRCVRGMWAPKRHLSTRQAPNWRPSQRSNWIAVPNCNSSVACTAGKFNATIRAESYSCPDKQGMQEAVYVDSMRWFRSKFGRVPIGEKGHCEELFYRHAVPNDPVEVYIYI